MADRASSAPKLTNYDEDFLIDENLSDVSEPEEGGDADGGSASAAETDAVVPKKRSGSVGGIVDAGNEKKKKKYAPKRNTVSLLDDETVSMLKGSSEATKERMAEVARHNKMM